MAGRGHAPRSAPSPGLARRRASVEPPGPHPRGHDPEHHAVRRHGAASPAPLEVRRGTSPRSARPAPAARHFRPGTPPALHAHAAHVAGLAPFGHHADARVAAEVADLLRVGDLIMVRPPDRGETTSASPAALRRAAPSPARPPGGRRGTPGSDPRRGSYGLRRGYHAHPRAAGGPSRPSGASAAWGLSSLASSFRLSPCGSSGTSSGVPGPSWRGDDVCGRRSSDRAGRGALRPPGPGSRVPPLRDGGSPDHATPRRPDRPGDQAHRPGAGGFPAARDPPRLLRERRRLRGLPGRPRAPCARSRSANRPSPARRSRWGSTASRTERARRERAARGEGRHRHRGRLGDRARDVPAVRARGRGGARGGHRRAGRPGGRRGDPAAATAGRRSSGST